ncbi:MAG: hypothetical protein HY829_04075 [Actinobacteria bacterium]|nr:hypothetical protein [Actinomycetota bacterium]
MADEDGNRAKRAAESGGDTPGGRPKRFVTPDWDDWDGASGPSPDNEPTEAPSVRGGRFAATDDEQEEPSSQGRGRYSWADEASAAAEQPESVPPDQPDQPDADHAETEPPQQGTRAWRPIAVDPAPGASRAAQNAPLGEKRRREAPALPTNPQPTSPSERREALIARERAGRPVAPGSLPEDDWTDVPLPASAVPPPAPGHPPTPIAVQEGDAPVAHGSYTRPADEPDEDTLWLRRRPSSRAAEGSTASERTPPSGPGSGSEPTSPTRDSTATEPTASQGPESATPPPAEEPGSEQSGAKPPAAAVPTAAVPTVAVPTVAVPTVEVTETGVPGPRSGRTSRLLRNRGLVLGVSALLVVVVIVVGYLVVANRVKPSAAASSQTTAALVERLVTPGQLSGVGAGGWTEQKTESTLTQDSPSPLCYVTSPDMPTPGAQAQRKLTASSATVLHRIAGYASSAEAGQAYAQRLIQLGQCSNIPAYLMSGATVSWLGDAAAGVQAVVQDTTPQYHTLVVVRTGSAILSYDVAQSGSAVPYENVLAVAAQTVTSICSSVGGACSASPAPTPGVPPATAQPGWLAVSDLPRVTPGMGRWNATPPKSSVTSTGSACENLTLATAAGPTQRRQRTYLLTEDTKVPKDFGLDEVILDFDTPDAAAAFASQLKSSIADCPTRTATAKLGNTADITAKGATGQAVTGFWRTVTQSTSPTTSFIFRVGVGTAGTRVVYLLATPSTTFDFTDADWAAITVRAGQRATQGG